MKIKQTIIVIVMMLISLSFLFGSDVQANSCGEADTNILSCSQDDSGDNIQNNGIWGLLLIILNILTAGVGIAAVGGIVFGSVLYASAGDSSEQTKKAKTMIVNVIIGIAAYALMYSVLNFLIPGGLFN